MLEAWATLLDYRPQFPEGFFSQTAVRIFTCYIQCHLAAPDGLRGSFGASDNGVRLDEICDFESDDRELFADQLCTIGAFGRLVPGHVVGLLNRLLESRVQQFEKSLLELHRTAGKCWSFLQLLQKDQIGGGNAFLSFFLPISLLLPSFPSFH